MILTLGIMVGAYYYSSLNSISRLLLFYLLASFIFDILSRVIGMVNGNNLILWPLLGLLELAVFSKLYLKFIKKRKGIWTLVLMGIVYMLLEIVYIDSGNETAFQPYSKIVASFLVVLMVLVYFFQNIDSEVKISRNKLYLNFTILVFFAFNLVLLLPLNFLINEGSDLSFSVLLVYLIVNLLFYSYLIYFIWKNGKNPKPLLYGL